MCRELQLEFLSRRDVQSYLAMEFPEHRFPPDWRPDSRQDRGQSFFMSELSRYLRDQGVVTRNKDVWTLTKSIPDFSGDLPESIRGMIQRKIDELDEVDRRLLLAGSVQGHQFDSAVSGWAIGMDPGDVEERLERLERVFALVTCIGEEELPDRVSNLRYRFVHILFSAGAFEFPAGHAASDAERRRRPGARACSRKTPRDRVRAGAAVRSGERQLEGRRYLLVAAQQATRLFASTEAAVLAQRALGTLRALPEDDDRKRRELKTLLTLIPALVATTGYASQKVGEAGERAVALCETLGHPALLVPALISVWQVQFRRAFCQRPTSSPSVCGRQPIEPVTSSTCIGDQSHWASQRPAGSSRGRLRAPSARGRTRASRNRAGAHARVRAGRGVEQRHVAGARAHLHAAPRRRRTRRARGARLGARPEPPIQPRVHMRCRARRQLLHDDDGVLENAAATVAMGRERDFAQMLIVGRMYEVWAKAMVVPERADLDTFTASLERYRRSGAGLQVPHYLGMLAEIDLRRGERARSVDVLVEALELARDQDAGLYQPELLGLLGDSLQQDEPAAAEDAYLRARDLASTRGARLLELRAGLRHALLLVRLDRRDEGRALLTPFADLTKSGAQLANVNDVKELTRLLV